VATLVGTKSFGKASVQSVRVLQDNSALLLTIAKYQTPNGDDISKKGIEPDVVVEVPTGEAESELPEDEEADIQLEKAKEILRSLIYYGDQ
jgi:carboxyl-terminal processing protease